MAEPKTLLQMSGAPLDPASLAEASLVLIDCQEEYRTGALPLPGVDAALEAAGALLARARVADTPVLHVAHAGRPGGLFDRDADRGRISDPVAPIDAEPVIEKALPNAFAGTTLLEMLEGTGRKKLIVVGFMTHMCVSSTVRAAIDLGYFCTVPADACATRDLPAPDGGTLDAATLHRSALTALSDRFAIVAPRAADVPD